MNKTEYLITVIKQARKALMQQKKDLEKRQLRSYKVNNAIKAIDKAVEKYSDNS